MLESNDVPSSLVTVCGAPVVLVQVTVVPTVMVMVVGLKPKLPVDESMAIAFVGPDGVAVVPVVGVGVLPPPVEPPHAASTIIAAKASRTNHARPLRRLDRVAVCVFKSISFLFWMYSTTSSE